MRQVRKEFLVFGSPRIEDEEIAEVVQTLKSGWLSTGPKVEAFEHQFSEFVKTRFAVGLNSCTAGLHLAFLGIGIKPGDEIITSPMTFAATANTIIHACAKPVFVDIEKESRNIDPGKIEANITSRTRAIVPVHFAGYPCKMDQIMELARNYNLFVINDSAHALETTYSGKTIARYGDISAYSFYATKNITTGEGGMVATDNEELAEKIQILRLHGLSKDAWNRYSNRGFKHYEVMVPGYKYNMMDIQAAMGIHQLRRVQEYHLIRCRLWDFYMNRLQNLPIELPELPDAGSIHARHLFTILLSIEKLTIDRDHVVEELKRENIGSGIHFTALHLHPYYAKTFGFKIGDFPEAEYVSKRTLSLPLSPKLTESDCLDVCTALERVLLRHTR
ncbi:MAG: UDP-4-amino-4,6-dideoxy-N-acetyl-beta-L-altrosamine transaminase [Candidatus Schekmanbacteria bacterium RBG_13_48_7]|uniref:UDP-4-amino-4, 6-dideoxy-N-acetyl-beta-L-altrosamine transaminase n=1 Tax=Candidatus Schekmanbacteria bacterium RBG_13_48_7 TaxID=1817878 RepID=A0A1F7RMX2_9BACT|nr:MAG: UDP-4-amino-4,6-dideoxy-N-acetyl-beta-L-altrosamine transaminase [Candidatus Schekmanbacteria bacterium RBG_13_48_7]